MKFLDEKLPGTERPYRLNEMESLIGSRIKMLRLFSLLKWAERKEMQSAMDEVLNKPQKSDSSYIEKYL